MEYRRLGKSGLEVGAISLGNWATIGDRLDDDESFRVLTAAYDLGVNFFDSAETYGDGASEEALGRALGRLGWPRETYVLSSKVYWGVHKHKPNTWGLSRKHVFEACHAALRRLKVDYLDLYLCHRYDPNTPLLETVRAMSDLVTQGKVLYWGTSEWTASQVSEAHGIAREEGLVPSHLEQLQYNMLVREKVENEFRSVREKLGLGITTWSPLAYGLFAGRYDRGMPADARLTREKYSWLRQSIFGNDETGVMRRIRAVNSLAYEIGTTPNRLALAWALRNPMVDTAICGASSVDHIRDNVRSLDVIALIDDPLCGRIDELLGIGSSSRCAVKSDAS